MKVFVYTKSNPCARICILTGVDTVQYIPEEHKILIHSTITGDMEFDTRYVKTSVFQN